MESKKEKLTKEQKKAARAEARRKRREEGRGVIAEFKKFINRGSVVDLSVGVVIGGAFSAIVTAVTNIFLSICTWGLPGGLNGLVTCLPAADAAQAGIDGIGQSFSAAELADMTYAYGVAKGITVSDDNFVSVQNLLVAEYTNYGGVYYYNGANLIDWGTLINAVITFFLIAIVLFLIVKTINVIREKNEAFKAAQLEAYYNRHPEERPVPPAPEPPAPSTNDILIEIRDELKKQNGTSGPKKD